jgi:hypothetical protein
MATKITQGAHMTVMIRNIYQSRFSRPFLESGIRLMPAFLRMSVLLLLTLGVAACEQDGALILESQYDAKLVGDWQGTVAGESESISFRADGSFTSQLQQTGFISTTLGQGVVGSIDGRWDIQGNVITLAIESAENEKPLNLATTSTIVSFKQNELVINSARGGTSTFVRALKL